MRNVRSSCAATGLVTVLFMAGACSKFVPTTTSPDCGVAKAGSRSSRSASITEAGIIDTLNGAWRGFDGLPAHLTIHAAPFEVVGQGPAGAKLRISVWLCCTQDSFVPVRKVFSKSGKVITVVRKVYSQGQLIEVPLLVDATMGVAGGVSFCARLERSREDWGRPLDGFVHGVDIATETGARLATAPEEMGRAETWLHENQARKVDYDRLKQALESHHNMLSWSRAELAGLIHLYLGESEKLLLDGQRLAQEGRGPDDFQLPPEMPARIRADYLKFQAEYLERVGKVAAAERLLEGE